MGSFKKLKLILSQFLRLEVEVRVLAGLVSTGGSEGISFPCYFISLWCLSAIHGNTGFVDTWPQSLSLSSQCSYLSNLSLPFSCEDNCHWI